MIKRFFDDWYFFVEAHPRIYWGGCIVFFVSGFSLILFFGSIK